MALTRDVVEKILVDCHIEHRWEVEDARLPAGWVLRTGSGIAGRSHHWFAWHLPSNTQAPGPSVTTKAALYRLLGKLEAGDLWRLKLDEPVLSTEVL